MMRYELLQLINIDTLKLFMDNLYELIKTPLSIIDIDGNVIVSNKERKFCDNYGDSCSIDRLNCTSRKESFMATLTQKEYYIFKCKGGTAHIAVPIIVNDEHLAYLISGNLLFEETNIICNAFIDEECGLRADGQIQHRMESLSISKDKLKVIIKLLLQFKEILSCITSRHAMQLDAQEKLTLSKKRFNLIVEGSNDVIWEWNMDSGKFFISERWKDLTGFDLPDEYNLFSEMNKIIHPQDIEKVNQALQNHVEGISQFFECEYRINTRSGAYKWIFQKGKILKNAQNKHILMAGSITDITHKKIYEEEINYLAYYDVVTNLPNRIFFEKKLNEEINRLSIDDLKVAFFFIDIDDFKKINDNFGHEIGDKFLLNMAYRLQRTLEKNQVLCRFGGDEFLLAIWSYENIEQLTSKAEELISISSEILKIDDKEIRPSLSVGISTYNETWGNIDDMLKYSDIAMYKAKKSGKNRYILFDEELFREFTEQRNLELDLSNALSNNEFILYYQPQIDIVNKKVYGIEALLRWKHPELGVLSPARFIDIIERSEMVHEVGRFVLREACAMSIKLEELGYKDVLISINVCEKQLMEDSFLTNVKEILENLNISGKNICFEITERILLKENKVIVEVLNELRSMGIEVFIDDFGIKYSSLNYLNVFNVSGIKIDKAFIDKITSSSKDFIITKNIVQLTRDLNIEVIAEGVETKEQLNSLEDMKCSKIQGYFFSKPISSESLIDYVKEL